ncbi:alcohol dehydrogenase catalytic domain-containing protein [Arthrobacter sp. SAFR-179]|uniref:alcohol dehydrogenase catalytic domain-containing protein n=1 Tax=Arthrobacter sp. SAFR-179 TaxID=3387279 RepID=UPI003F7BE8EB
MQITAAVARENGAPFTIEQLELDDLRHNEVRVRMVATGICHTDTLVRDGVYPTPLPAVLGHEGAGIVEAVGDSSFRWCLATTWSWRLRTAATASDAAMARWPTAKI